MGGKVSSVLCAVLIGEIKTIVLIETLGHLVTLIRLPHVLLLILWVLYKLCLG